MKRLPFILTILLLAACSPLVGACGKQADPQGTGTPSTADPSAPAEQAEREYDLDGTAETAMRLLGGEAVAAYAVLKAFDSGFSPYQIAHAVETGLIDETGAVAELTPAWPSGDTMSRNGVVLVASATHCDHFGAPLRTLLADTDFSVRSDFEQMFEEVRAEGQSGRWLVWVFGATGAGYSAAQITDYLSAQDRPFTDVSPPTVVGVPVVADGNGSMLEPELPPDWPYNGRNILADLQNDEALDFDDNLTVLVIGMVNAGYSSDQIWEALKGNSIGLCTSQADSGGAVLTAGYVENGAIVPPAETTPFSPAEVVIDNVIPRWPLQDTASLDDVGRLKSGEAVTLTLTPYLPSPDVDQAITAHEVVMELTPADQRGYSYDISGSWRIELVQETEDMHHEVGTTFVLEGEFSTEGDKPMPLDRIYRLPCDYTYTAYTPDGEIDYAVTDDGAGFSGSLDEDLEGDGVFGSIGPCLINWDTFPVDQ